MKRAIKVLSVLAVAAAMAWVASPAWASCPGSIPIAHHGNLAHPNGPGRILSTHPDVNGFFWEVGKGNPADGLGNDGNSNITGYPAFTNALALRQWIKGTSNDRFVSYDWFNFGIDNCVSVPSTSLNTVQQAAYVIDGNDEYAVLVVAGRLQPVANFDYDAVLTGLGPNSNDVPLVPRTVAPQLANVSIVDAGCVEADVLPAAAGLNMYTDAGGPYAGVVDVSGLALSNGGAPAACSPATGCHLTCIARNANLCWGGNTIVAASQSAPSCQFAPTIACTPGDPTACFGGAAGACLPGVTTPFGPPIVGGCTLIGGDLVDDNAIARATKSKGFTVFTWTATEFAVSHYNILDVTRGERQVNSNAIARKSNNDGTPTSYEFVATGSDIKGGKKFELEMVRTDGQTVRFPVE